MLYCFFLNIFILKILPILEKIKKNNLFSLKFCNNTIHYVSRSNSNIKNMTLI